MRQQNRLNTQQVRRARDGSRREQHLDGVLIEVDDDEDDDIGVDVNNVDAGSATAAVIEAMDSSNTNEPTPSSLNEDLEVQDALLALRLRNFLKWNGVDESMLKFDSCDPTTMKPFLEDGSSRPDKMDVDVQQTSQPMSSRHLVTVLRMRGTCGPRQGPSGLGGFKDKREKSKLRICSFKAGDES